MRFCEGLKLCAYDFPYISICVDRCTHWKVLILIESGIKKWVFATWAISQNMLRAYSFFIVLYEVEWFPWVCECLLLYCNLQHLWDTCPQETFGFICPFGFPGQQFCQVIFRRCKAQGAQAVNWTLRICFHSFAHILSVLFAWCVPLR